MVETHSEHENLFRDEDMIEYGPDTEHLSTPMTAPVKTNQRVLAEYDKGEWRTEAQVMLDGEWYVATRNRLNNPPEGKDEWRFNGRVKSNYGMFSNLPTVQRILLAPLYAIGFAVMCVKGKDVNLQVLDTEE